MTDMTPEEINQRIATWLGLKCTCKGAYWGACEMHSNGGVATGYYHTNAAMDLLGVLVERGYKPELSYHNLNWWHKFSLPGYKQPEYYAIKPTIPAAICTAIIELIEREGKEWVSLDTER